MKKISVTSACSAFQWPIAAEFVSKKNYISEAF